MSYSQSTQHHPEEFLILIADDEPNIRFALKEFLSEQGYRVQEAEDGEEAYQLYEYMEPDLIITDITMPGISGIELLKRIKETDPYTPIILITGFPSVDAAVDCLRIGASDYISKPFELHKITESVQVALRKRRRVLKTLASPSSVDAAIPIGYSFIRSLGEGASGSVYLIIKDSNPEQLLALKVLRINSYSPEQQKMTTRRFSHEIRAASMINHPNVITVYGHGLSEVTEHPYVIMEYVPGQPLSFFIRHNTLQLGSKIKILKQVASALHAIHEKGICHRDVKPDNVLVNEDLVPKLTDFGIAHLPDSDLTNTAQMLGSPSYMSPEAYLSAEADHRSDIFAFGIVAYELLHGKRLFQGNSLVELMNKICRNPPILPDDVSQELPEKLRQMVIKCLSYCPEDRFQDAQEIADLLSTFGC